jgi:DNA mismatch repair ATPase MutS
MAGKSTFLRCLGINMILAYIGAPVDANKMKFSSYQLFTSMRTSDSLSKNESYFYAELKRLKQLLDEIEDGSKVFFLLDEILKGTNSSDKQKGSQIILERLIKLGATGMIATHDLELGKIEDAYPDFVKNMCFEIEINDSDIRFDYKLRKGITQKMNATLLMKQMGIID